MIDTACLMFVSYNRLELTKRFMANLRETTDVPYRLVIIDNGSTDDTRGWLAEQMTEWMEYPHCIGMDIQLNEKNLGIATGRNQALRIADQYGDPYLSTLDNDVEMPMGWLSECIDFLKVNPNFAIGVNMERVAYPLRTFNGKTIQYKEKGNLGTACTVMPKRLHDAIGFFTTEYAAYGEDDANFFFRARMAHFDLGYIQRDGNHFGEGEYDTGEYRQFKDDCRKQNLDKFFADCRGYFNKTKPIYIPYSEKSAD
jgi:GT2 family glycosyltransferase